MRRGVGLALAAACAGCARYAATTPPAPPPPQTPLPAAAAPPAPAADEPVSVCVLQDGRIAQVAATYRPATGDTVVDGRLFADAYPATTPPYAVGAEWFVRMEPLQVGTGLYSRRVRYGLPRVLAARDAATLRRVGERGGIPLFAESADLDVIYVPVQPGCVFQPYQAEYDVRAVRGR